MIDPKSIVLCVAYPGYPRISKIEDNITHLYKSGIYTAADNNLLLCIETSNDESERMRKS